MKEPSDVLLKERKSGDIKRKKPIKVVQISGKKTKPTLSEILLDVQSRVASSKLQKMTLKKLNLTEIDKDDMFTVCRLGYDGILENKDDVHEAFNRFKEDKTLLAYEELISPLFNIIVGHKTLKEYCPNYITNKELNMAKEIYHNTKAEAMEIGEEMVKADEEVFKTSFVTLDRIHGLVPNYGKTVPPVRYNLDNYPIRYPQFFSLSKEITHFEREFPRKKAIWKGFQTKAFLKWLYKQ